VGKLRFATAEIEQRNKYASIDKKEIPFLPNKKTPKQHSCTTNKSKTDYALYNVLRHK